MAHISSRVRRFFRASKNLRAIPDPMKKRMLTNLMSISESAMSSDANQFITAWNTGG